MSDDGLVWFVERAGNNLGRLDPVSGAVTEFAYPTANAELEDLALDGTDGVWVVATAANQATRFDIAEGKVF